MNLLTMRVRTSSDDDYHGAMDNDQLDISDYNQDDHPLELIDLLSDEEDDGGDVEEDVIDFLLAYNLGHNILELYNVLVQIRLATSKTKRNI